MGSNLSKSKDHFEDLPDEVFVQILNLVPIQHVIRCATVSKRWNAACRYVIRTRESLLIVNDNKKQDQAWKRYRERLLQSSLQKGVITLADMSLVSAMMMSLNQMVGIRRLVIETRDANPLDIIPFIRKFAEQLTMLEIDFAISMIGADAFPHLTRLRCRLFDAASSAAFPKLAELIVCGLTRYELLPNMWLPSLKKLLISKSNSEDDTELVRDIILANAENLTDLQMSGALLRLGPAVVFPNLTLLKCRNIDSKTSAAFPKLAELVICGLKKNEKLPKMRLPSLKKLIINWADDAKQVKEFILANAGYLSVLEISGTPLRLDRAVVFLNLVKMDCMGLDNAGIGSFPALKHLSVVRPVMAEFLNSLFTDLMLSLDVDFSSEVVVSAISKMRNLKILKLTDRGWREEDTLSSIFDNMHHLEKVRIACVFVNRQGDRMIATLANQNPKLSHVSFDRITLTDAALTSLAQLQHLTDLSIHRRSVRIHPDKLVTTGGILTLLRGASRDVIRKLLIGKENVDCYQVTREIGLMCEEQGMAFDKREDFSYVEYEIRA